MIQEKNRLRRNRDRAVGEDRDTAHRLYRNVKNKIRSLGRQKNLSNRVAASNLEKDLGKDPRKYWKNLKKLTGLEKPKIRLPDKSA